MRTVSHYELSGWRPVILEVAATSLMATAPRKFPYGRIAELMIGSPVSPHRENYTDADAQAVCDMLNERLKFTNTTVHSPVAITLSTDLESTPAEYPLGGRGVSPVAVFQAAPASLGRSRCSGVHPLSAHECY